LWDAHPGPGGSLAAVALPGRGSPAPRAERVDLLDGPRLGMAAAARLIRFVLLAVGLPLGASQNDVLATPSDAKLLKEFPECFHHNFRWFPDIAGTDTKAQSLTECQSMCAHNVSGCAHFAYWPTSGKCYFGDFSSHLVKSTTGPIAGRGVCQPPTAMPPSVCSTEMPNDGFPGKTFADSNAAWPSGRQPWGLECWPVHWTGGYVPCATVEVLEDTRMHWPGKCRGLTLQDNVTAMECPKDCMKNPLCPAYQVDAQGNCWQGLGRDCFIREDFHPLAAQRLQHGHVRKLMDLAGWQIIGLSKVFDNWAAYFLQDSDAIRMCRNVCYSDIRCQYWQYSPKFGCWAEDASEDYHPLYPLTLDFAYRNTPFAIDCVAGEFIQHSCPAAQTTAYPTQAPVMSSCMRLGVRYTPNLLFQWRTNELSAENCQARCNRVKPCKFFAYWPDTSCYLQGKDAEPVTAEDSQVVSGPASCMGTFEFDDTAKDALNPEGTTPTPTQPVLPMPSTGAITSPVFDPAQAAPDYLAEVRFDIKNLDYSRLSDAQRPVLQQKLLETLATGLGAPPMSFSEQPGGPPGTVLLQPWVGGHTALTGFLPNDPPTMEDVQRIRHKVGSSAMLASLAEATTTALGASNPAITGDIEITSPRAVALPAPEVAAAAPACNWWCRWWPIVAAIPLLGIVALSFYCVLCKEHDYGKKGMQRRRKLSAPVSTEDSEDDFGGDANVWAEEPAWNGEASPGKQQLQRSSNASPEKLQWQPRPP